MSWLCSAQAVRRKIIWYCPEIYFTSGLFIYNMAKLSKRELFRFKLNYIGKMPQLSRSTYGLFCNVLFYYWTVTRLKRFECKAICPRSMGFVSHLI